MLNQNPSQKYQDYLKGLLRKFEFKHYDIPNLKFMKNSNYLINDVLRSMDHSFEKIDPEFTTKFQNFMNSDFPKLMQDKKVKLNLENYSRFLNNYTKIIHWNSLKRLDTMYET